MPRVAETSCDNYSCRSGDSAERSQARHRKHGITDDNIRHAINNSIAAITRPGQPDFTMLIGPDATARLLEVGVIETEDQDYVIHAMTARDKYLIMIETSGGDPQ